MERITIGLKWVAASDNLPIRILFFGENSLYNFLIGSRPNIGKVEKQKSGAGAAQRVLFFFPIFVSKFPIVCASFRPSCPRQYPSIDHHHHHHHNGFCSAGRLNELNVPRLLPLRSQVNVNIGGKANYCIGFVRRQHVRKRAGTTRDV